MDSIREFFKRIKDRPSIYLVMLALTFVFSAAEAYNPVIRKYGSFGYVFEHNYMKTLSGWTEKADAFFAEGSGAYFYIMIALLCVFVLSALVSVALSGYVNVLMSAVNGQKKKRGGIPLRNKAEPPENYGLYFSCNHIYRSVFLYADLFRYTRGFHADDVFRRKQRSDFYDASPLRSDGGCDASGDCFLRHVFFLYSSVDRRP